MTVLWFKSRSVLIQKSTFFPPWYEEQFYLSYSKIQEKAEERAHYEKPFATQAWWLVFDPQKPCKILHVFACTYYPRDHSLRWETDRWQACELDSLEYSPHWNIQNRHFLNKVEGKNVLLKVVPRPPPLDNSMHAHTVTYLYTQERKVINLIC